MKSWDDRARNGSIIRKICKPLSTKQTMKPKRYLQLKTSKATFSVGCSIYKSLSRFNLHIQ